MSEHPTRPLRDVLIAVYLCLGLSALLNVESLVEAAGRLEHGPRRELALSLVTPLEALSTALWLDRPHAALRALSERLSAGEVANAMAIAQRRGAEEVGEADPGVGAAAAGGEVQTAGEGTEGEDGVEAVSAEPEDGSAEANELEALPDRPRRTVSPQAPLQVWALGDSLLTLPAFSLQQSLYSTGLAWLDVDTRHSTGLARPDHFDWPAEVERRLEVGRPDVAILMFGANDGTAMVREQPYQFLPLEEGDWASPDGDWAEEYGLRVGRLMDRLLAVGAEVIWVGIPPVRDPVREAHCEVLNAIFQDRAASRPGVSFLDTREMFSDGEGGYTSTLSAEDGTRVPVRSPDGVHLNEAGAELLADRILELLDDAWGLSP